MSAAASSEFNVWTWTHGDDESWELQLTTSDYAEAVRTAERLGREDVISAIYELGRYEADGLTHVDHILFWWSRNGYKALEAEPERRGFGWPEHGEDGVEYQPVPSGTALTVVESEDDSDADEVEQPKARYRQVICDECGKYIPQNEAYRVTDEVETGRSSASYKVSTSSSRRSGAHNSWSNTSRQGLSRSSGRHYYKNVQKWLCESCYQQRVEEQGDDEDVGGLLGCLLWIVGGVIVAALAIGGLILLGARGGK